MRILPTLLLAGAAAIAVTSVAAAEISKLHTMTVRLPDGGVEQIRYSGDVAPKVTLSREPSALPAAWLGAPAFGAPVFDEGPFAMLDQISAQMDRDTAAMLRQAGMVQALPFGGGAGLMRAEAGRLPAGVQGYSMVSSFAGDGGCMRSVEITSRPGGQAPQVIRRSSGNCGDARDGAGATPTHALSASPDTARLIQTNYRR